MEPILTTILLATDGSAASALARVTGAALHLVHAWHVPDDELARAHTADDRASSAARHVEAGRAALASARERLEASGATVAGANLCHGAAAAIVAEAATVGADLLVTGSRGAGQVKRVLLGSVAEGIVRRAACPVLVVRGAAWPPARIVVGVADTAEADQAAALAARLARAVGADLLLLRSVQPLPANGASPADGGQSRCHGEALRDAAIALDREAATLAPLLGRAPATEATAEDAAIALLRAGEREPHPALIAVGTRGTAPAGQLWLGSTALQVLTCAPGSVLVYPHRAVVGGAG